MRRPKVLVVGEAVQPSGYATVLNGFLPVLAGRYEVHVFALTYQGPPVGGPWQVHPNALFGDVWGMYQIERLVAEIRPELVLFVYDAILYLTNQQVFDEARPRPRVVLYCPIDGRAPEPSFLARLAALDRLVLFTESARGLVRAASPAPLPGIDVIPHGVDTGLFRRLDLTRAAARRLLFPGRRDLDDAFLVLNANRNALRKRVDLTIEGFARFARGKPEGVLLCLHMDRHDHFELADLARQHGVAERILYTAGDTGHPDFAPERLNLLYNACEVGVNTSGGEGWGLVAFEHAAAGGAQIVPRHSACAELWSGAAMLLEPASRVRHVMALCEYEDVTAEGTAAALEALYSDRALLAEMSRKAQALATRERFAWEVIGGQWDALLRGVLQQA